MLRKSSSMIIPKTNNCTVIMVKDFDKALDSDKGFQNKILKLAETSKSPFILICGKRDRIFLTNRKNS